MTGLRRAYSSTVVAPGHIVAAVVVAAAVCAATAGLPAPGLAMAAAGAAAIVLTGIHPGHRPRDNHRRHRRLARAMTARRPR